MKFAAIDIGANAVRLLISNVFEEKDRAYFKKDSLIRVPIRLGDDVFEHGEISEEKATNLVKAMIAFRCLIEAQEPVDFMACATSAMREARNAHQIVDAILSQTQIPLQIIDGRREAELIFANHVAESLDRRKSYLYIDVGGGSTEVTLFAKNTLLTSNSFKIGAVRMLSSLVSDADWQTMKKWLQEDVAGAQPLSAIGTGGNINTLFKLSRKKEGKPLGYKKLQQIAQFLNGYTLDERVKALGLRPDRADVIIPAARIYLSVMKWAKIGEIFVPQVGLADGIIHVLYERYKRGERG